MWENKAIYGKEMADEEKPGETESGVYGRGGRDI
jgi:hypothetical protein